MILVTGATGLVGARFLYDLLIQGEPVRALRRESSDMAMFKRIMDHHHGADAHELLARVEWFTSDILDVVGLSEAMSGCREVYHAAAMVSFHPKDARQMYAVNVNGTANVVDCCLEHGVERLLHVSSVAALGRSPGGGDLDETAKWVVSGVNSDYALSKYESEMEVWRGQEEGLAAVIINPALIIGPTDPLDSSGQIFLTRAKSAQWKTGGLTSIVDVRDVSKMAIDLMRQRGETERFILSAESMETHVFYQLISKASGREVRQKRLYPWMLEVVWRLLALKDIIFGTKSPVTKWTARSVFHRYTYDGTKVTDLLNYPYRTPAEAVAFALPFFESLESR